MLPLSVSRSSEGEKENGSFQLSKIKPGMRLNWWPYVGSEPSMISVKVKSAENESGFGIEGRVGCPESHRRVVWGMIFHWVRV